MKNAILVSRRLGLVPHFSIGLVHFAGAARASGQPTQTYCWRNVQIGGGGFVTGIIFNPSARDLIYLRTDIGGAYRWDAGHACWRPLLDWLDHDDTNLWVSKA